MNKPVLLVIDMQVGNFVNPNPIYNADKLLNKIQSLIKKAREADIPVFYIQNNGEEGDPDEYGTTGWFIHSSIKPQPKDVIIQKNTPDSFHNTILQEELNKRDANELIIGGLQTEYCVSTTCHRAFDLGYKIILAEDAHSTWDSEHFTAEEIINHHNHDLGNGFAILKKEQEILF